MITKCPVFYNFPVAGVKEFNLSYTLKQADIVAANDKGALGATFTSVDGYTAVNGTQHLYSDKL